MENPPPTDTTVAFFMFILRDAFGFVSFFSYIYTYTYFFGSLVQCIVV